MYYASDTPITNTNATAPKVQVGTTNNQMAHSTGTDETTIPQLFHTFPTTGHIMLTFKYTLIGIIPIYDADCTVTFSKCDVTVFALDITPILVGWLETTDAKIWCFYLLPDTALLTLAQPGTEKRSALHLHPL